MMRETLPAMLTLAGPHIGRETVKPVSIKATEKFKGEVKIGEPTVVDYMDNIKVTVVEMPEPGKGDKKAPATKAKKK